MSLRSHALSRQRGVAVITALLLTTLAITIVASLFWQQQVQVRSIENQRLQLQKKWILRGALDWASLILREDLKHSTVDHLGEPWAVPLAETRLDQYVENGRTEADISDAVLSGSIVDAQSRYNLANLCVAGTINPEEVAVFERLLANLQQNPALARATANMMTAAQKKPATLSGAATANGAEPPAPQPMNLTQVDDLLAVPGFSVEAFHKLKDFVVVLPRATPTNVNTAPAEVLAARLGTLSLADAAVLVAGRDSAYFRSKPDFVQRLPGKSPGNAGGNVAVTSDYFLVNGKVRLSRATMEMQALIERSNSGTKVIWIREE